eukprot:GHVU01044867.1.p1 GENE.GHVU01044867.1~~GHVU01044867.1.p1  ORF type:complete len:799 (+),score=178.41 GHVU01044867.1:232-2397(+)
MTYGDVREIPVACHGSASLLGFETYVGVKTAEIEFSIANAGSEAGVLSLDSESSEMAGMVFIDGKSSSEWDGSLSVAAGESLTARAACHPKLAGYFVGSLKVGSAKGGVRDSSDSSVAITCVSRQSYVGGSAGPNKASLATFMKAAASPTTVAFRTMGGVSVRAVPKVEALQLRRDEAVSPDAHDATVTVSNSKLEDALTKYELVEGVGEGKLRVSCEGTKAAEYRGAMTVAIEELYGEGDKATWTQVNSFKVDIKCKIVAVSLTAEPSTRKLLAEKDDDDEKRFLSRSSGRANATVIPPAEELTIKVEVADTVNYGVELGLFTHKYQEGLAATATYTVLKSSGSPAPREVAADSTKIDFFSIPAQQFADTGISASVPFARVALPAPMSFVGGTQSGDVYVRRDGMVVFKQGDASRAFASNESPDGGIMALYIPNLTYVAGTSSVTFESERSRFTVSWNAMGIQGETGALVTFQMRWGRSGDVYVAYEAVTTTTTTSARTGLYPLLSASSAAPVGAESTLPTAGTATKYSPVFEDMYVSAGQSVVARVVAPSTGGVVEMPSTFDYPAAGCHGFTASFEVAGYINGDAVASTVSRQKDDVCALTTSSSTTAAPTSPSTDSNSTANESSTEAPQTAPGGQAQGQDVGVIVAVSGASIAGLALLGGAIYGVIYAVEKKEGQEGQDGQENDEEKQIEEAPIVDADKDLGAEADEPEELPPMQNQC